MEAFPAAAGVADRSAGPDGVRSPGPQAGYGATPVPSPAFSPLNMAGPGKRRLPWAGWCCHCNHFLDSVCCCPPPPIPPSPYYSPSCPSLRNSGPCQASFGRVLEVKIFACYVPAICTILQLRPCIASRGVQKRHAQMCSSNGHDVTTKQALQHSVSHPFMTKLHVVQGNSGAIPTGS